MLERVDGIIAISSYVKNYILEWGNLESELIYFPSYGKGPYELLGNYENEFITIINPSGVKGIDIFIGIADRFPNIAFAAVPTWATKEEDIIKLKKYKNITILSPENDVDIIYKKTKILLVPSLWGESFGQVVVEAMLRGIPVIASKIGGLTEAIQGCDYTIPVNPIERYIMNDNNIGFPEPVIPEQNIDLWIDALTALLSDKERYDRLSLDVRKKAIEFVQRIGISQFINYFQKIINKLTDTEADKKNNIKSVHELDKYEYLDKIPYNKMDEVVKIIKRNKIRKRTKSKV